MPKRKKTAEQIYRARLKNLKKARAAKKRKTRESRGNIVKILLDNQKKFIYTPQTSKKKDYIVKSPNKGDEIIRYVETPIRAPYQRTLFPFPIYSRIPRPSFHYNPIPVQRAPFIRILPPAENIQIREVNQPIMEQYRTDFSELPTRRAA